MEKTCSQLLKYNESKTSCYVNRHNPNSPTKCMSLGHQPRSNTKYQAPCINNRSRDSKTAPNHPMTLIHPRTHITTHLHNPPFSFILLLFSLSSNLWTTLFRSLTCRRRSANSCTPLAALKGPSSACPLFRSISSRPGVENVALATLLVEVWRGNGGLTGVVVVFWGREGDVMSGSICCVRFVHDKGRGLYGLARGGFIVARS